MNDDHAENEEQRLVSLAIAQQKEFDALAAEFDRMMGQRNAWRRQMLADLTAMDRNVDALCDEWKPVTADERRRIGAENQTLMARFENTVDAYANTQKAAGARFAPMRDALSAFYATRARLVVLGVAAPDLIENEWVAASLAAAAFKVTGGLADPAKG